MVDFPLPEIRKRNILAGMATPAATEATACNQGIICEPGPTNFSDKDRPTWDLYSTCIHCGLCLNHCPTYRVLGTEMDSPRGRIFQIAQVDQGKLKIGHSFVQHIDRCLDCRACETACPSGVQYGRIVERARAQIEQHYSRPLFSRITRGYFLKRVIPDFQSLKKWASALRFYQASGLQSAVRSSGILKLLGLHDLEALAPPMDKEFFFDYLGQTYIAQGVIRGKVAFHAGCIANVAFAELNRATIRVLTSNGVEVTVPQEQGCCGALQAHAGFRDRARELARHNIDVMQAANFDAIVTNAAGCGSTLKEYADLLGDDPQYSELAKSFDAKVKDVTEYLAALGLAPPQKKFKKTVTYQDPCHLAHGQRIRSAPRDLLRASGAALVEMANPDHCCGSAGTYNVTQNDLSMKILDERMADIAQSKAEVVATANVGCMLQLKAGCRRKAMTTKVMHVIEVLDACYEGK